MSNTPEKDFDDADYGGLMGNVEIIDDPRDYELLCAFEPGQQCSNCDCGRPHTTREGSILCMIKTTKKKKGSPVALNAMPPNWRCRSYIPNDPAKVIWIRVPKGTKANKCLAEVYGGR